MTTPAHKSLRRGEGSSVRFDLPEIAALLAAVPHEAANDNPRLAEILGRLRSAKAESEREAAEYETHLSRDDKLGELHLGFYGWKLQSAPDKVLEAYVRPGAFREDAPGLWSHGPVGAFADEPTRKVYNGMFQACLFSRKRKSWQMIPGLFKTSDQASRAALIELERAHGAYAGKAPIPGTRLKAEDGFAIDNKNHLPPEMETGEPIGRSQVRPHWRPYTVRVFHGVAILHVMSGAFMTLHNDQWHPARAFWRVMTDEPAAARRHGPFCTIRPDSWAPTVDGSETFRFADWFRSRELDARIHVPAFTTRSDVVGFVAGFDFVTIPGEQEATSNPGIPVPIPTRAAPTDLATLFA